MTVRVRKRKVYARHSWENNFYLERIQALAGKTVIEVSGEGQPDEIRNTARRQADQIEKIAVLAPTGRFTKKQIQRVLGISPNPRTRVEFIFGSGDKYLSSRSKKPPDAIGITVDERFARRFKRYGFEQLLGFCSPPSSQLKHRVSTAIDWLFESRREPRIEAAVVKTTIALESLLILDNSESLVRALAERAAFILSSEPQQRKAISKVVKSIYDARSSVVHGGGKKAKTPSPALLEVADRLTLMLCLMISSNAKIWGLSDDLRGWCENEKWGSPTKSLFVPYPSSFLRKTLALVDG